MYVDHYACRTPFPAVRSREPKASPFPLPPTPTPTQAAPSIPPLMDSPPPAAAAPDLILNASCKSPLNDTSTRIVLYNATSYESQSVVRSLVPCMCTHVDNCTCPLLQVLLLSWESKPQSSPNWFLASRASFRNSFDTYLLRGHVSVVDSHQGVLYLPLNAYGHFPEAGTKIPHETLKQINLDTFVTFLSTLINPPDSNIATLVLEPCLTQLSSLSFKESVRLVHSAKKSISKPVRFEVRMCIPNHKVLSYCRAHNDAPRVCITCFAQSSDPSVTECGVCSPPPSLQSYAAAASAEPNLSDQVSSEQKPSSPDVAGKLQSVESQLSSYTDNFRTVLEKLCEHSRKLSSLETQTAADQWSTHTSRNCSSTKSVDKVKKTLYHLEIEVNNLTPRLSMLESFELSSRLSQLESSVLQIRNQLDSLQLNLKSLTPPSLLTTPSVSSTPRENAETEAEAEVHNIE